MALNIIKQVNILSQRCLVNNKIWLRSSSLYEPDYLKRPETVPPLHKNLNIQIRSYNFPVLEKYQSYVHKLLKRLNYNVRRSWIMPPQTKMIDRFKPNGDIVETTFTIDVYERNLEISPISSIHYPLLIRIMEATLPQGVTLHIARRDSEYKLKRYIPDAYLLELKQQLADLQAGKKRKTSKF